MNNHKVFQLFSILILLSFLLFFNTACRKDKESSTTRVYGNVKDGTFYIPIPFSSIIIAKQTYPNGVKTTSNLAAFTSDSSGRFDIIIDLPEIRESHRFVVYPKKEGYMLWMDGYQAISRGDDQEVNLSLYKIK